MTNITECEKGSVKAVHHSTSSTIEVIFKCDDGEADQVLWLDYYTISDLLDVISTLTGQTIKS